MNTPRQSSQKYTLDEINEQILRRVDKLQHLAQKGCPGLQMMGKLFEETREQLTRQTGDELAFLNSPEMMYQLMMYESMNPRVTRREFPISSLVIQRELLIMMKELDVLIKERNAQSTDPIPE